MSNRIEEGLWIVNKNGQQVVYDHQGNPIPFLVWTRVTCAAGSWPTAIFKAIVNVADSEEDMRKRIEEANG